MTEEEFNEKFDERFNEKFLLYSILILVIFIIPCCNSCTSDKHDSIFYEEHRMYEDYYNNNAYR